MLNLMSVFRKLFGHAATSRPRWRTRRMVRLQGPEVLEARLTPANLWEWVAPAGGDGLWNNPNGGNWNVNGAAAAAGTYPGMPNSVNDAVVFDNPLAGPCTLNVPLAQLHDLDLNGWGNTLALNDDVTVNGSANANGSFELSDGSTINLSRNTTLNLLTILLNATWSSGNINGGAGSAVYVTGTSLNISDVAGSLSGPDLIIRKDAALTPNDGNVTLSNMTGNLQLNGQSNVIDVQNGGYLNLNQSVAAGQQNLQGGIDVNNPLNRVAVKVESGGQLERGGLPVQGVPDQVKIGGAVYNFGGTVVVDPNNMLSIQGADINGYSYWQQGTVPSALLKVARSGNLSGGVFFIDIGKVSLETASTNPDELDTTGLGLYFNNTHPTTLQIDGPGSGSVVVQGLVTLAANTTTTMNYVGSQNTAGVLNVSNGTLKLAGKLSLTTIDGKQPTQALTFLEDTGNSPPFKVRSVPSWIILAARTPAR